jgi:ectoine hydroxylase-related dioxygenase (phytanoyl-CoA dioxygenase family)
MDPGTRGAFSRDLRSGPALRALCYNGPLCDFFSSFLNGPVHPLDKILVRNVRVGSATPVHFDWVYFTQGTADLYTAWIPIGDVPLTDGPLAVLEGSHTIGELRQTYGQLDAFRDGAYSRADHPYFQGFLTKDAPALQERFARRWLTTEFVAGDLLIFGMFTLHCSLDNKSPVNRIRLSVDVRYQRASDRVDQRWMGEADRFGEGMD